MRVISLSVDGIVQSAQRGLYDWLANQDADLICLQDLRARERDMEKPEFELDGYFAYFFDSGTKNYNGVAIYTRVQPKALIYGLGFASGVDMEVHYLRLVLRLSWNRKKLKLNFLMIFRPISTKLRASVANIFFAVTGLWRIHRAMLATLGRINTIPVFCRTNANGLANFIIN
jgi:exonuclease III